MDTNPNDGGDPAYVTPQRVLEPAGPPPPPPPPPQIVLQQPGGLFGRFGKFLVLALLVSIIANIGQQVAYQEYFAPSEKIRERYHSRARHAADKIALIRVEGVIIEGDGFVKRQIDQVLKDESVKAVVLRIDSPGGTVTASDYLYHHLKEMVEQRQIPLVVSMGSLCASGGYYVAMAVGDRKESIFAEPTSWTGSIGVIIPHFDVSELLARWNIQDDSIASGRFKQMGSPTRKLTETERAEERAILKTLVDETFARFKTIVQGGRPALKADAEALAAVTTGQIFTAPQARKHGLVDRIGFVEDAIDRAAELAKLDKENVRVVKYTRHVPGLVEAMSGTESRLFRGPGFDLRSLLDLTAPRAYYLCTWLPSILSTADRDGR